MMRSSSVVQTADAVLLVRPAAFGFNAETAASNSFQQVEDQNENCQQFALHEFDEFAQALTEAGVKTCIFQDSFPPARPDAVFPGNWISFHHDGRVVLYPMSVESRRVERLLEVIDLLARVHGFHVRELVDLTEFEAENKFLEGTGSLVLDHVNGIAFACRSSRTHPEVVEEFARRLDYEAILFDAVDETGRPVYHTDVMMCVGHGFTAIAADCIPDAEERRKVCGSLERSGREIIELSRDQLVNFAGNMLNLRSASGESLIVLSERAKGSLSQAQTEMLLSNGVMLSSPLPTIENLGGGSARCMIAEIFLPRASETIARDGI